MNIQPPVADLPSVCGCQPKPVKIFTSGPHEYGGSRRQIQSDPDTPYETNDIKLALRGPFVLHLHACPPPQHISSRRHKDRAAGKPPKPKFSPYTSSPRPHSLQSVSALPPLATSACHRHHHRLHLHHLLIFLSDPPDPTEDPEPDQTSGLLPHTSVLRGCRHGLAALLPPPCSLQLKPRPLPGTASHAGAFAPGPWTYRSVTLPDSVFSLLTSVEIRGEGNALSSAVEETGVTERAPVSRRVSVTEERLS